MLIKLIIFMAGGIVGFHVGVLLSIIPCIGSTPTAYCSAHGGGAIFVGLALAIIGFIACGWYGLTLYNKSQK